MSSTAIASTGGMVVSSSGGSGMSAVVSTIPVGIAVGRQRQEPPRDLDQPPPPVSARGAGGGTISSGTGGGGGGGGGGSPVGGTTAALWPLPPTPCTLPPTPCTLPPTPCTPGLPTTPFWLAQGQFSGVFVDQVVLSSFIVLEKVECNN